MFKRFLTGVFALGLASSVLALDGTKIGVVDSTKILQNSIQLKEAQDAMHGKFDHKEKKLMEDVKAYQAKAEKFRKDKVVMKAKSIELEERKLNDEETVLNNRYMEFQKEVNEMQKTVFQDVQKDLERSIRIVAENKKLDLVVFIQTVGYYNKAAGLDITDAVAKKMAEFAKVASKVEPPAKPAPKNKK